MKVSNLFKKKKPDDGYEHKEELNGVTAFVFSIRNEGVEITVSGFHPNRRKFKKGDRILLIDNGHETRYKITDIRCPVDPDDQYFMDCVFHPRFNPTNQEAR